MREAVRRVVILQVCITIGAVVIAALGGGTVSAWSSLVGGALGVIPTLVYWCAARLMTGTRPAKVVGAHLVAEFLKIATTLVLFAFAIIFLKELQIAPLLGTFFLSLTAYWIALYLLKSTNERRPC